MASVFTGEGLRFLYRTEEGAIDRRLWWMGALPLVCGVFVLTLGWMALRPWATRGLDERALIDPLTLAAYVYLLAYALAVMLAVVCFVMLSMKRLRDRGRPPALAGALPLAALLVGALHWVAPQVEGAVPDWAVLAGDVGLTAILVWTTVELGFLPSRRA